MIKKLLLAFLCLCPAGWAAIGATALTSGSTTSNVTNVDTASVTLHANRLELLAVQNSRDAGLAGGCAATSTGATWHELAHSSYHTAGTPTRRVTLLYTLVGSNATGIININFGGNTQDGIAWSLTEFDGVNTSGTDGIGALVQSATNSGGSGATQVTCTLANSFSDAVNNVAFGMFGRSGNGGITPGSGFTEIHDVTYITPSNGLETEWKTGQDLTVDASWTGGTDCGCVAAELAVAAAGPGANIVPLLDEDGE